MEYFEAAKDSSEDVVSHAVASKLTWFQHQMNAVSANN